jgi:hypothetical protein
MLTIFSAPKAFSGHIAVIQRNAIKSWLCLGNEVEVILLGDDPGVADAVADFDVKHIPDIERNQFGTPTISSILEAAQNAAKGSVMAYVNADIMLTSDVKKVCDAVPFTNFLICGQRWDLDVESEIEFSGSGYEERLREMVLNRGKSHGPTGMDCFIFPKGMYKDIPAFGVGRAGWDSWLVYWTRRCGIPIIDATNSMTLIHQNHDYAHHPLGIDGTHGGPEAEWNLKLAGGAAYVFTIEDADWILDSGRLMRAPWSFVRVYRAIRSFPALHLPPTMGPVINMFFALVRFLKRWTVRTRA